MSIVTLSAYHSCLTPLQLLCSLLVCKKKTAFGVNRLQRNNSLAGQSEDPRFKLTVEGVKGMTLEKKVRLNQLFTSVKAYTLSF